MNILHHKQEKDGVSSYEKRGNSSGAVRQTAPASSRIHAVVTFVIRMRGKDMYEGSPLAWRVNEGSPSPGARMRTRVGSPLFRRGDERVRAPVARTKTHVACRCVRDAIFGFDFRRRLDLLLRVQTVPFKKEKKPLEMLWMKGKPCRCCWLVCYYHFGNGNR